MLGERFSVSVNGNLVKVEGIMIKDGYVKILKEIKVVRSKTGSGSSFCLPT